jgi:chorismate-pyruvate lyase
MSLILLEDWAKANKVRPNDAKNWARRSKIEAVKQPVVVVKDRWLVEESTPVPSKYRSPMDPDKDK